MDKKAVSKVRVGCQRLSKSQGGGGVIVMHQSSTTSKMRAKVRQKNRGSSGCDPRGDRMNVLSPERGKGLPLRGREISLGEGRARSAGYSGRETGTSSKKESNSPEIFLRGLAPRGPEGPYANGWDSGRGPVTITQGERHPLLLTGWGEC